MFKIKKILIVFLVLLSTHIKQLIGCTQDLFLNLVRQSLFFSKNWSHDVFIFNRPGVAGLF